MATQMQQPVPFVYFHVLKLMMVIIGALTSYELVYITASEDSSSFSACVISTGIYVVVIVMLVGLNAVGGYGATPVPARAHPSYCWLLLLSLALSLSRSLSLSLSLSLLSLCSLSFSLSPHVSLLFSPLSFAPPFLDI